MNQEFIARIEDAALNAWPSPRQMVYDGWLLRFTGGESKRVNSVNIRYASSLPLSEKIAFCESSLKPDAVNGPYAGLFQFCSSTWISNRKALGLNPNPFLRYNAEEAVKTAAFKIARDGTGAWPVCGSI